MTDRTTALRAMLATLCLWGAVVSAAQASELTFAQRVAAQAAIERVYHAHRSLAPPFDAAVTQSVLEAKVRRYLEQSHALETYWNAPITAGMLEREVQRMARESRKPERLAQLFAALGDDPVLVQECLARAVLADRLTARLVAADPRIQGDARREAEHLRVELLRGTIDPRAPHPRAVTRLVERRSVAEARRWTNEQQPATDVAFSEELDDAAFDAARASLSPAGTVSPLRDERDAFVVEVPLESEADRLLLVRYRIPKVPRETWLATLARAALDRDAPVVARADASLPSPAVAGADPPDCLAGEWRPLIDSVPEARVAPSSVWTGAEMIVWGGSPGAHASGDRYDPATDSWTPVSTSGAPAGHIGHSAVWSGTEMIVWGGRFFDPAAEISSETYVTVGTGGRYDPAADAWTPVSMENAPAPRAHRAVVWTGSEMIVWGNQSGSLASGGRYDPATDAWTPMTDVGAPGPIGSILAIWTGAEMILWGTYSCEGETCNAGARYEPGADAWLPMAAAGAPEGVAGSTAVWTGTRMIVWGGESANATVAIGGLYDPAANTWTPTSELSSPSARKFHSAVWTGERMIVWGGTSEAHGGYDRLNTGASYDPLADAWTPLSGTNAPAPRQRHVAVWTGEELIVWGGEGSRVALDSGGRYDPQTDGWVPTAVTATGAPVSRSLATAEEAVWTGSELFVWAAPGNGSGESGRYDPATASWRSVSTVNGPGDLNWYSMVWSGTEVILWAGVSGARYDPLLDQWSPMSTVNGPSAAGASASTIWTGSEMIVWGGDIYESHGTGGRYDPVTDTWTQTSTTDAPAGRQYHSAVWTGSEMIVWGGRTSTTPSTFAPGGRYDLALDAWAPLSDAGAPAPREAHSAVWTGSEMIIWGGMHAPPDAGLDDPPSGGRYDPATDAWSPMSIDGAPPKRWFHTAVWTGDQMLVWGGSGWQWQNLYGHTMSSGGHYDPLADRWQPTGLDNVPDPRFWHVAAWTGDEMLVWGGRGPFTLHYRTGGLYGLLADGDGDGHCGSADCDAADPAVHPGAPEVNDGQDNQCPGDTGFGMVDELAGDAGLDGDRLSWTAQPGATSYEVARSSSPGFDDDCTHWTTAETYVDDPATPATGLVWFYLTRALAPNAGSWGQRSDTVERVVVCAMP